MSDIDDDMWYELIALYKQAYPNSYPARCVIIADMIASYKQELEQVIQQIRARNAPISDG